MRSRTSHTSFVWCSSLIHSCTTTGAVFRLTSFWSSSRFVSFRLVCLCVLLFFSSSILFILLLIYLINSISSIDERVHTYTLLPCETFEVRLWNGCYTARETTTTTTTTTEKESNKISDRRWVVEERCDLSDGRQDTSIARNKGHKIVPKDRKNEWIEWRNETRRKKMHVCVCVCVFSQIVDRRQHITINTDHTQHTKSE